MEIASFFTRLTSGIIDRGSSPLLNIVLSILDNIGFLKWGLLRQVAVQGFINYELQVTDECR